MKFRVKCARRALQSPNSTGYLHLSLKKFAPKLASALTNIYKELIIVKCFLKPEKMQESNLFHGKPGLREDNQL